MPDSISTADSRQTYYEILQVPPTATFDSIKASYQRIARQLHPDKRTLLGTRNEATDSDLDGEFLRLQSAWECLRTAATRKDYDESLAIQNRHKTKSQPLTENDLELVEEEDTGDFFYVYTCRCGEDLWMPQSTIESTSNKQSASPVYITCDGCSLVFSFERVH